MMLLPLLPKTLSDSISDTLGRENLLVGKAWNVAPLPPCLPVSDSRGNPSSGSWTAHVRTDRRE